MKLWLTCKHSATAGFANQRSIMHQPSPCNVIVQGCWPGSAGRGLPAAPPPWPCCVCCVHPVFALAAPLLLHGCDGITVLPTACFFVPLPCTCSTWSATAVKHPHSATDSALLANQLVVAPPAATFDGISTALVPYTSTVQGWYKHAPMMVQARYK